MLTYKQVGTSFFPQYDQVPMRFCASTIYAIEKHDRGLCGFSLVEISVEPFAKDFCIESSENWKRWDLSNWAFFMAYDGDKPVGAAAVASRTKEINMLAGRDDLAVLWDIRVDESCKRRGVGQRLFNMVVDWSRRAGLSQMKIECQNNNVAACKFYHKQGAVLCEINEYAYYNEPEYRHEAQLVWYLDITRTKEDV